VSTDCCGTHSGYDSPRMLTVGLHLNFQGNVTELSARIPHGFLRESPTRFGGRSPYLEGLGMLGRSTRRQSAQCRLALPRVGRVEVRHWQGGGYRRRLYSPIERCRRCPCLADRSRPVQSARARQSRAQYRARNDEQQRNGIVPGRCGSPELCNHPRSKEQLEDHECAQRAARVV
jgi:hypothetical protein